MSLAVAKRFAQPLVGIAAVVGRRAVEPDVVEFDLADVEHMELADHGLQASGRIPKLRSKRRE